MKMINFKKMATAVLAAAALTSCTSLQKNMKEANTLVGLQKADFTLSDQVTGSAKEVKILMVDWARLFKKEKGYTFSTPLIGTGRTIKTDKAEAYALNDMLSSRITEYDAVFYPSFEKERLKILFFYSKTEVTVRARLGKLNK